MSSIEQSLAEVRAVLGEIADGTTDASTRDRLRDVVSRIGSAAELTAHFAPRRSREDGACEWRVSGAHCARDARGAAHHAATAP